jgi:hypothetical protein
MMGPVIAGSGGIRPQDPELLATVHLAPSTKQENNKKEQNILKA